MRWNCHGLSQRGQALLGCLAAVCVAGVSAGQPATADRGTPARLQEAVPPVLPARAATGGEVVVEILVDASGSVAGIEPLRTTPPYTDAVTAAVSRWRFSPAMRLVDTRLLPAPSRVLVAAVFRPPSLYAGPRAPARVQAAPSPYVPVPGPLVVPPYPPAAIGDGVVIIEIELTARAEPRALRVLTPRSGFDEAAREAARQWRFAPPTAPDAPDTLTAYAVFGFRTPVVPDQR